MPLSPKKAVELAREAKQYNEGEREYLDTARRYWKGRQRLPAVIPDSVPREVQTMARIARVNVCAIVVDTLAQSTFVDGFRAQQDSDDLEVWAAWQANRMDARQAGIHRAAFGYGASYATVLPGSPYPVIRGISPRRLTAVYGEDADWPMYALHELGAGLWRLLDEEAVYYLSEKKPNRIHSEVRPGTDFELVEVREHGAGVTPVVRYLDEDDLDADDDVEFDVVAGENLRLPTRGQVAPLAPIQDQIDMTTFGLLVAQHYSAFRQRYAIGWVAPQERELLERMTTGEESDEELVEKAAAARRAAQLQSGASQFWTFDEHPEEMKLGEFSQTELDGYIKSREASMKHAATLSQTPVHELIGELVNLSAEALAAAESGRDRKIDERQTLLGESHEQMFWLVGRYMNVDIPDDAQVVWRDTSARAFAATVDGLGKLTQMLGIPPQELWERVPGATKQDIERWKAAAEQGNAFQFLADTLARQAGTEQPAVV